MDVKSKEIQIGCTYNAQFGLVDVTFQPVYEDPSFNWVACRIISISRDVTPGGEHVEINTFDGHKMYINALTPNNKKYLASVGLDPYKELFADVHPETIVRCSIVDLGGECCDELTCEM